MTEWLMVIITAIYMIATVIMCYYNAKLSKTTKEQTEEIKREYLELRRPRVTIRFDVIRTGLLCFIVENEGEEPANNVRIRINNDFIENIGSEIEKEQINKICNANLFLARKQKMYICLGGQSEFEKISQIVADIDIEYDNYIDHFSIDLKEYGMFLVYNSPIADIANHMKGIKEDGKKFHRNLLREVSKSEKSVKNIVIHSETEDEANKYKIFKLVCCEPHITVEKIAEKIGLEKEYILDLLIELDKVDGLVGYNSELEDNDYLAEWYKR